MSVSLSSSCRQLSLVKLSLQRPISLQPHQKRSYRVAIKEILERQQHTLLRPRRLAC